MDSFNPAEYLREISVKLTFIIYNIYIKPDYNQHGRGGKLLDVFIRPLAVVHWQVISLPGVGIFPVYIIGVKLLRFIFVCF